MKTVLFLVVTAIAASSAGAQDYPNRPIRFVTAAVGGGNDFAARMIAHGLTASLGQQVIVDNRGGAHIPQLIVAKATPDGYTILVQNNTVWVAPLLEKVAYDHFTELAPITLTARAPNILVVHPSAREVGQGADRRRQGRTGRYQLCLGRCRFVELHRR